MNISGNKGTEVGKYTAVISLKDKEHYVWKDNSNTDISIEWNINKILVDKPSVDNTEFTYNGKEQTLNINGFDSEIMSIINNKASNAGKYTAVISLKDKEHYAWKDHTNTDISIEWNVNKILVDKPSVDNTEFTYNGKEQTLSINGFDSEIMSITNNKASNAGKYTAVISLKDKNNYVWSDNTNTDINVLWNINKCVVLKPVAKKVSYEFNSKEQTLLLDNFDADIMNIVNNTGVVVNEYTAVVSLKDKNNYVWEDNKNDDISILWNIVWPSNKIVLDTPILNNNIYSYDGNEIVIKTSEYNTELITLSGTTGTDIGEYKAVFSLKDKEHYSWSDGTSEDIEYVWSIELAKPSLSKSVQYNSITLEWNPVKDASYIIYNCDSKGKKCKSIGTTSNTSYVIKKLSFNKSYYYKVKVNVKIGENSYNNISNLYGVKTALSAPVLNATTDYYQYTKLSWTKVSGATKYYIYRCNSSGSKCSNVASTSKTSYTYKGGSEGYAYKYKVRAYKSKTYGSYSNLVVGKKVNDAISFSVSNTGYKEATITINNTTPSAIAYKIYRSTSKNGKYSLVTTLKGEDAKLKYVNTKLSFNKTYYYKVVASSEFNSSAYSSYKYVTTKGLAKPTITTTLIDDNKAKFETNKVYGATGYEYYYSTDGKNYKLLKRTTSQSYTKTFSYKKYYLKVRSYFYNNKKYYYSSFTSINPITFIETLKGISINIDSKVPLGEKIKLSVDYTPSHIIEDITYTVSDESIAEIINGEFIGKKEGNVIVSATSESGVTTSKDVYVYIGTTKFEINKKQTTVYLNDSETLVVNFAPSNATFKDIKWSSSDSSIATVDSNGVVKGIKEGITKITASNDEGKKYTSYVTVKEQPIIFSGNGFDEINNLNLTVGVYTAKILLADDSKINAVDLYDNNGTSLGRLFHKGNKNNDSAFIKRDASSTLNNAKLQVNIIGKWTIIIEKQIVGKTDFEIEGDYRYISETLVGTGSYVKIDYELLSYGSNVILYYPNSYNVDIEGQITTIEYLQSISITGSSSSISGSRVVFLEKNKKYFLSVESTDHWKVKMSPFKPSTSTWNSISGTGNSVSNIFTGTGYPIVFDLNVNKIDDSYDFFFKVCEYKQNNCYYLKNIYSNNGDYSGKVSFVSEKGKQYFLSIETRANWTIKVGKVSGTIGNTISGTGDYVSGFYEGKGKNYTFNINLDSASSDYSKIYIYKYDKYYDYTSLVSTQELSYSGESVAYLEKGKKYYFVIETKGDWNINIKSAPSNKIGSVIEGSGDDAVGYIIGTGKYYILEGEFLENKNSNRCYYTSVNFSPYNYSYPTTTFSVDLCGQYFKGKTIVFLEKGVKYYVSVKSNTKWKVKFSTSFSTLKNKSISGNGYSVSGLFTATSSTMSFNVKTDKPLTYNSNVVDIYGTSDASGYVWEQLVWSYDAVNKKVKVKNLIKGKKYFFVIRTGGDWSISW